MKAKEFTLAEYIEANNLGVDGKDSFALKIIAKHLRELGYHPKKARDGEGKTITLWSKNDRAKQLADLQAKLNRLEGRP